MSMRIELSDEQLETPRIAKAALALVIALTGETPARVEKQRKRDTTKKARKEVAWADFEASLSEQTREFLSFVQEHSRMTMADAQALLGLNGKGLGGLTGALKRKADNRGLELPISRGQSRGGRRLWCWKPAVADRLGIGKINGATPAVPEAETTA